MLDWLTPGQAAYCDTDSCTFLCDHDNPNHKSPFSDPKDMPKGLSFGDALGQWSNESGADEYNRVCLRWGEDLCIHNE